MGQVIPFIQNPEYFFKRGVISYQNKDWNRSIRYLQRAIELRPLEGVFHCQLAAVLSDMGRYERSNEILLHVLDHIDEGLYDCYYFLANNYAYLGLFDKSREAALNYLALDPEGEFSADIKDLLELLDVEVDEGFPSDRESGDSPLPDELILQYERAGRLINEGHYQKAEQLLQGMVVDYPSYYAAYNQLARTLHLQGRTDEAIDFLSTLLAETTYVPAACQLTLLLEDQQLDQEADQWKQKLRQLAPIDKSHMYKLAATHCRLGEYEQALLSFHFLQKQSLPEKNGSYFYRYGVAAFHCGYNNRSWKAWKTACEYGHEKAASLLQKWKEQSLKNEEVQCDHVHDLSFGLD
ncbi:tetratricopeptide (TPR) repeat protein [Geomicrobium halophilum]|uniref:Tetratricopeptide (TPR) repeat protein n=1 Tax=Geomicrobium halophilum TaxID=549000 RepID=A0A841PZR9_9BACL|nr:tetratricopeptide repeat protein [Geomicrobium halophilum]MBB6450332.1 tetratricopeptide (TPR) repeat protein [Geomicrobium halophilum]